MERKVGTISRGIRCPIIREGDNLAEITVESILEAAKSDGYEIRNKDIVALTEKVLSVHLCHQMQCNHHRDPHIQ